MGSLRAILLAPSLGPQIAARPEAGVLGQANSVQGAWLLSAQAGRAITSEVAENRTWKMKGV